MPLLHDVRDIVVRDKGRTMFYKEPKKGGRSERGIRRNQNATIAYGTET
jgi:hypothetical protein